MLLSIIFLKYFALILFFKKCHGYLVQENLWTILGKLVKKNIYIP